MLLAKLFSRRKKCWLYSFSTSWYRLRDADKFLIFSGNLSKEGCFTCPVTQLIVSVKSMLFEISDPLFKPLAILCLYKSMY